MQYALFFITLLLLTLSAPAADLSVQSLSLPTVYIEQSLGQYETVPARDPADYWIRGARNHPRLRANRIEVDSEFGRSFAFLEFGDGASRPTPVERTNFRVLHYSGAVATWNSAVPAYLHLDYLQARTGIDIRLQPIADSASTIRLNLRARLAPAADPANFLLQSTGRATIDAISGIATINVTNFQSFRLAPPLAWQERNGARVPIAVAFRLDGESSLRVTLGAYRPEEPLFLETALQLLPYDLPITKVQLDANGSTYAVGSVESYVSCGVTTGSRNIPCTDAWLARFAPDGSPLYFARFQGNVEELALDLALTSSGELLFLGRTLSSDFPVSSDAMQKQNAGPLGPRPRTSLDPYGDLFLARLRASDAELLYATYYGGAMVGESGSLTLLNGTPFLLVQNLGAGIQASPAAWIKDRRCPLPAGFCTEYAIARWSANLSQVEQLSFLPTANSWTLNSAGGSLLLSASLEAEAALTAPLTAEAAQRTPLGGREAYLAILAPTLGPPLYATLIGTVHGDQLQSILPANTSNISYDLLLGVYDNSGNRYDELIRLAPDNRGFLSRRRIAEPDAALVALHRDSTGRTFVTASTVQNTIPTSSQAAQALGCASRGGSAALLLEVSEDATSPVRTYVPGASASLRAIPNSPDPLTFFDGTNRILRLLPNQSPTPNLACVTGGASRMVTTLSPGQIVTLVGAGIGPDIGVSANLTSANRFPLSLAGVEIKVNGVAAPLLYAQANQVNAILPYEGITPGEQVNVELTYANRTLKVQSAAAYTGVELFTMDFSGSGQAVALNQDGTLNSESNPAPRESIVVLYGTGIGVTAPASTTGALAPISGPNALARPIGPVVAFIGGRQAEVHYAGAAPGLVNGAAQFNLRVPATLSAGSQNIDIRINGSLPNNLATVWVR